MLIFVWFFIRSILRIWIHNSDSSMTSLLLIYTHCRIGQLLTTDLSTFYNNRRNNNLINILFIWLGYNAVNCTFRFTGILMNSQKYNNNIILSTITETPQQEIIKVKQCCSQKPPQKHTPYYISTRLRKRQKTMWC